MEKCRDHMSRQFQVDFSQAKYLTNLRKKILESKIWTKKSLGASQFKPLLFEFFKINSDLTKITNFKNILHDSSQVSDEIFIVKFFNSIFLSCNFIVNGNFYSNSMLNKEISCIKRKNHFSIKLDINFILWKQ